MSETATWSWQARDATGRLLRGTQTASDAAEVASRLRSEGRVVLAIDRTIGAAMAIPGDQSEMRMLSRPTTKTGAGDVSYDLIITDRSTNSTESDSVRVSSSSWRSHS